MDYQDIYEICDTIYTFADVAVQFYDTDRQMVFEIKTLDNIANTLTLPLELSDDGIRIFKADYNMKYLATQIKDSGTIVIGPYLQNDITYSPKSLDNSLVQYIGSLPVFSEMQIRKLATLISTLKSQPMKKCNIENSDTEEELTQRLLLKKIEETQNIGSLIRHRYSLEKQLLHLVGQGRFDEIIKRYANYRNLYTLDNRIPDDPIRCLKNYLIVDNTSFRLTVEHIGVHPIHLHNISEKFALLIEKIKSKEDYYELLYSMVKEYCELVKSYSTKSYSKVVKSTIEFIISNTDNKLSTAFIAKSLHVNPSYLSRQFKRETGKTLVKYIQEIKVNESKYYLLRDQYSITEIAHLLGFNDSNYFTRVFKKITGITPNEYANSNNITM